MLPFHTTKWLGIKFINTGKHKSNGFEKPFLKEKYCKFQPKVAVTAQSMNVKCSS